MYDENMNMKGQPHWHDKIHIKDIGAVIASMGVGVALGLALCKIIGLL